MGTLLDFAHYSPGMWLAAAEVLLGLALIIAAWLRALVEQDRPHMYRVYAGLDTMIVTLLTVVVVGATLLVYDKADATWTLGTLGVAVVVTLAAAYLREHLRNAALAEQIAWEDELDAEYPGDEIPDDSDAPDERTDYFAEEDIPADEDVTR